MTPATGQLAVIDTNVLLDWLVFQDPAIAALAAAVERQDLVWIASQPMLDELAYVLLRPALAGWQAHPADVMVRARHGCRLVPELAPPPARRLHCTDPDDQKFIDLALAQPARWLISRDKALLRLARRARARGVEVLSPTSWTAGGGPA